MVALLLKPSLLTSTVYTPYPGNFSKVFTVPVPNVPRLSLPSGSPLQLAIAPAEVVIIICGRSPPVELSCEAGTFPSAPRLATPLAAPLCDVVR